MDAHTLWVALALVLVIEGLLPFAAPQVWRQMFERVMQMTNGQIRFYGLCSILGGLLALWWLA